MWRCQEACGGSPQLPRLETGVKAAWEHVTFTNPKLGWLLRGTECWSGGVPRALRGWSGGRGVFLAGAAKPFPSDGDVSDT